MNSKEFPVARATPLFRKMHFIIEYPITHASLICIHVSFSFPFKQSLLYYKFDAGSTSWRYKSFMAKGSIVFFANNDDIVLPTRKLSIYGNLVRPRSEK